MTNNGDLIFKRAHLPFYAKKDTLPPPKKKKKKKDTQQECFRLLAQVSKYKTIGQESVSYSYRPGYLLAHGSITELPVQVMDKTTSKAHCRASTTYTRPIAQGNITRLLAQVSVGYRR